ncbi:hypothetical protein SKAU_G00005170 [Synaphobranchus kaupii]|uniref:G-protein coupled receptors family 1 profile domain-containing protein n=1 Tax=Synaphobranchus kaupii TaxID=118154 RepID=A0A9Q1JCZ6_SYNKA|nr:hypothetical protein SKAU_G00005170 [Synaphobranchus kaupii]
MKTGKGPAPLMMSNSTVCPSQKLHPSLPWLMVVFYLGGFLLNSLSLCIFGSRAMKWNSGVVLQFNLAISDMMVTPAAPFIVLYSLWDDWPFCLFLCQLKGFLLSVHVYGGICFLTLISIHRCSTVARHRGPAQSRMANPRFVRRLCTAVWVGLLLQGLPFFGLLDTWVDAENSTKCLSGYQPNMAQFFFGYNLAVLVVGVVVPFCVFGHLLRVVGRVPVQRQGPGGGRQGPCGPGHRCLHCQLLSRAEAWYYASFTVSAANCCLDPLLYCFSSPRFREALRGTLANARKPSLIRSFRQQRVQRVKIVLTSQTVP